MSIQRFLVHLFSTGLIASLVVACSVAPGMEEGSTRRSTTKNKCERDVSKKDSLNTCVDCCLAASPKAKRFANDLGACNAACGKKGEGSACFKSCEADYKSACKAAKGACESYDKCSASCM